MSNISAKSVSRRRFLKTAGVTALAASTGPAVIIPGRAQPKTLKILSPKHLVGNYDQWFKRYADAWGDRNNTRVMIDLVGYFDQPKQIRAQVRARKGHDLVMLFYPPAALEDYLIDHRELYQEAEHRYGKAYPLIVNSTYNPRTDRFFCFAPFFGTFGVFYRKDLWDQISKVPDSWDDVRLGGRKIKFLHDNSVGFNFGSEIAVRSLLYAFGASEQDVAGQPALRSKATLEALKYAKALQEEAQTEAALSWNSLGSTLSMLSGELSLILATPALLRSGEKKDISLVDNILINPALQGPAGRIGAYSGMHIFGIWQFADNLEGARQFVLDSLGESRTAFLANEFMDYPSFPQMIPDVVQLFANDAVAYPSNKYQVLADSLEWCTNIGYPGTYNAAIEEIFNTKLITKLFASVASGRMTPDAAMTQADQEVRKIYDKWRALGRI